MSIIFLRECAGRAFSVLSGFACFVLLTAPSCAQESETKAKEPAAEKSADEKPVEEKKDPFALPENGDAAAYVEFIDELNKQEPTGVSSQEEYYAFMRKVSNLLHKAGTQGLAQTPDEKQTIALLQAKVIGIISLYQLGDVKDPKEAVTLLKSYDEDKRETVASFAKSFIKSVKLTVLESLDESERKAFVEELVGPVETSGATRFNFGQLMKLGQKLEQSIEGKELVGYYQRIAKLAEESKDDNVAGMAVMLKGITRRLDLPGKPMELFGKTASGEDFQWKDYRGKVVLVDFWATWCGPCVRELPNVKANYKKYHEMGFEVVGVNLDDNLFQLEKFTEEEKIPWVNIFPENEKERGFEHPLASYYGIMAIPTTILVDRKGNVVALNVFGPDLEVQLEKLLGKPKSE